MKSEQKTNLILGILLIILAFVGIEKLVTVLLIVFGLYFIYLGVRR